MKITHAPMRLLEDDIEVGFFSPKDNGKSQGLPENISPAFFVFARSPYPGADDVVTQASEDK